MRSASAHIVGPQTESSELSPAPSGFGAGVELRQNLDPQSARMGYCHPTWDEFPTLTQIGFLQQNDVNSPFYWVVGGPGAWKQRLKPWSPGGLKI